MLLRVLCALSKHSTLRCLTLECQAPTTEKALARCCALQVCLVEAPDLAKAGSKVSAMISALGSKTGSQVALDSFVRYQIGEKA